MLPQKIIETQSQVNEEGGEPPLHAFADSRVKEDSLKRARTYLQTRPHASLPLCLLYQLPTNLRNPLKNNTIPPHRKRCAPDQLRCGVLARDFSVPGHALVAAG